jgi:hypothetical protein
MFISKWMIRLFLSGSDEVGIEKMRVSFFKGQKEVSSSDEMEANAMNLKYRWVIAH